jgi:hypothetical protein
MKKVLGICVLALVTLLGVVSNASTIAYADQPPSAGFGFGGNLALNFNVLSPITVTELGVYNAAGDGVITGTINVVIYNTTSLTQVTPVVTFNGTYTPAGLGFDVFQSITPVTLGAGSYQVVAVGFSATDFFGNLNYGSIGPVLNNGGGLLAFNGAGWDYNTLLDSPTGCGSCVAMPGQSSQFDAGTFQFTPANPVPEPGTLGLLGTSVIAAATMLRRKFGR